MSINPAHEDSVLVSLSTTGPDNVSFPERRIVLTESQPRMNIGRSSNRTTLGLFPMLSNGWFDSPVVKIRDAGSMHGTYLNDEKVGSDEARPVVAGDKITFGMPVYRNQTIFKPTTMKVEMEFRNATRANNSPSRVFTVPDDCSTDENFEENEPMDDDLQHGMSSMQDQQDIQPDEEQQNCHPEIRQIDGANEISSDCAPNDLISISSNEVVEGDEVRHDDDDESISLTDDEEMSSAPASPIESIDLGDTVQMDDDVSRSPSWNKVSTYSESEQMDEDSPSNRTHSDDEQGVFLYGSDSEDMGELDDVDPIDTDFDPSTQQSPFFSVPSLTGCTAPVLPSLSAAVFSQPHFPEMPFGYQLPPVVQSIPRQPSPSDAVLPLSHRHHGSEDDGAITVENLGRKWGKPDFFEAREHNKITISRLTDPVPSLEAGLVPDAATKVPNDAAAEDKCLRTLANDSQDHVASSATDTDKQKDSGSSQVISQMEASGQSASRPVEAPERISQCLESHAPQSPKAFEPAGNPSFLESGADFLKSPLHEAPAMKLVTTEVVEALDWTPASAYELQKYKQQNQAQKEQALEASRDLMDHLSINNSIGKPKDSSVNKRKAEEISEATQQELVWHDNGSSMPPVAPGTPAGQSEPKADVSLPSPPTTPQGQDRADARPSKKIRKIAERVGYAALGGATVGAMVFTSLIYTAPNFA
ncbi:hypothetical protein VM1G_09817 [Cytospora mali]|uniref:FHA domain-containing protein n=1 Tax=Cytospora mali TaxID=578113 RepID=A0A194WD35_CYTMA|nr:hypothetical protein VM1G_09817 [Valsa mali]